MSRKIPVSVITGFLGAGKTTLLQYVLTQQHGRRILVIQNEFADGVGIESPQLVDDKGDVISDMYELPNGCMCCSVRDSLIGTIDAVLATKPNTFDLIVVETSGVADPQRIVDIFWVDEQLESHVYLDGIITVVDSVNVVDDKIQGKDWQRFGDLFVRLELFRMKELSKDFHDRIALYLHLTERESQSMLACVPMGSSIDLKGVNHDDEDVLLLSNLKALSQTNHEVEISCDTSNVTDTTPASLAIEATKQIACASVILLNKIDLIKRQTPDFQTKIDKIQSDLNTINPLANILRCERGRVPLDQLVGLNAFGFESTKASEWFDRLPPWRLPNIQCDAYKSVVLCNGVHPCPMEHANIKLEDVHADIPIESFLMSICVPISSRSDSDVFDMNSIDTLLEFKSSTRLWSLREAEAVIGPLVWDMLLGKIYRYKALFLIQSKDSINLAGLQGVGDTFDIKEIAHSTTCIKKLIEIGTIYKSSRGMEFLCKFLFVGKDLKREELRNVICNNIFKLKNDL